MVLKAVYFRCRTSWIISVDVTKDFKVLDEVSAAVIVFLVLADFKGDVGSFLIYIWICDEVFSVFYNNVDFNTVIVIFIMIVYFSTLAKI